MSGWLVPGAAAAFWAGIVLAGQVGLARLPWWAVVGVALGGLAAAAALAPGHPGGADLLEGGGLLPRGRGATPVGTLAPARSRGGRGPPVVRVVLRVNSVWMAK